MTKNDRRLRNLQASIDEQSNDLEVDRAILELNEKEGEFLSLLEDTVQNIPELRLPQQERESPQLITRCFKRKQRRQNLRWAANFAAIILCIATIFTLGMQVKAIRDFVSGLLFRDEGQYSAIHKGKIDYYPMPGFIFPEFVPSGFTGGDPEGGTLVCSVTYQGEQEQFFTYSQQKNTVMGVLDTESALSIKNGLLGPYPALFTTKDGISRITWDTGDFTFRLIGNIPMKLLEEIALSVVKD